MDEEEAAAVSGLYDILNNNILFLFSTDILEFTVLSRQIFLVCFWKQFIFFQNNSEKMS